MRSGYIVLAMVLMAGAQAEPVKQRPYAVQPRGFARSAASVIQIDSGQISGVVDAGVASFKGIPYAAPPVGDLRWRPPQPVQPWTGIRQANQQGPLCMQRVNTQDNGVGPPPASEDCLYLDVYSPVSRRGAKWPVMFWIHGGGYVNGSGTASLYDGTGLAKQGVVLVSINYRLGRLGFFAHPALSRESPAGPLGNYAFMDQIAALQWVKRNIAAFGGDPANVTIFGESAGGSSVINLMISPAARGLFHRAISQSGVARVDFAYLNHAGAEGRPSAEELGKAFAARLGVTTDDVNALRAIPAQSVIDAGDPEGPMIDGRILTSRADVAFARHSEAPVPFLLGSNALEFPPEPDGHEHFPDIFAFAAARGAPLIAAYGSQEAFDQNIVSDVIFTETARYLARTHSSIAPTFLYRFSVLSQQAPPGLKTAPHASDRQYVFRTLKASPWPTGPQDEQASTLMSAYWVAFAKTGNPNGAGRPQWPPYSPADDRLIDFTNNGPLLETSPRAAALDVLSSGYH
jgi:para-nitrobenzyl esterase